MSSDARIRFQDDGNILASHDGPCELHPMEFGKYELREALESLEVCMKQTLAWEWRENSWLAGYCAR